MIEFTVTIYKGRERKIGQCKNGEEKTRSV
jgi:hypothetical protein